MDVRKYLPKNFTILLSLVASHAMLVYSFGYDFSIMLLESTTTMDEDLKLTSNQNDHFMNDAKWIFFLACVLSGFIADFAGRRTTLFASGYISCLGFTLMAITHSYGLLISGRLISLAGMGLGFPITHLYIGEIASPDHRGFLNTIPEMFSIFGLWFAVIVRIAVSGLSTSLQWRGMVGAGVFPSLTLVLGMAYMPESPCWFIMRGRVADAKAALRMTLKTDTEVSGRLSELRSAAQVPVTTADTVERVHVPPNVHVLSIWREVIRPRSMVTTLARTIISVLTLHLIQQSTGIDVITTEAMYKFMVPFPSSATSLEFITALAPFLCGRLCPLFLPLILSDVTKRRTWLVYSFAFTILSMLIVNVTLVLSAHDDVDAMDLTPTLAANKWCIVAFLGSFSIGLGPITGVHTSEVLPYKVRAQVIGIVAMLNRLMSFGLSYLKPLLDHVPNVVVKSLLYWILNVVVFLEMKLFGRFFIESKGQSLEALDQLPRGSTIELT
ncbi:Polyol transporter 5 [Linum grandiflorum]